MTFVVSMQPWKASISEIICPACYDKEGFTNGDLQRFGVSVEPCEETAVVVKAKKSKKVKIAKKAAPRKSTRAKK